MTTLRQYDLLKGKEKRTHIRQLQLLCRPSYFTNHAFVQQKFKKIISAFYSIVISKALTLVRHSIIVAQPLHHSSWTRDSASILSVVRTRPDSRKSGTRSMSYLSVCYSSNSIRRRRRAQWAGSRRLVALMRWHAAVPCRQLPFSNRLWGAIAWPRSLVTPVAVVVVVVDCGRLNLRTALVAHEGIYRSIWFGQVSYLISDGSISAGRSLPS